MMSVALVSLLLSGSPQAVSVRLEALSVTGLKSAEVEPVAQAITAELTAQGYEVLSATGTRQPMATLRGSVTTSDGGYVLDVMLVRTADDKVLADEKVAAKTSAALRQAGTELARRMASEIRLEWGVRARVKFR